MEKTSMNVAIYYPWLYLTSGAERSILEFVKGSQHSCTIFTNHYDAAHTYPEFRDLNVVELPRVSVDRSFLNVLIAGSQIARQQIDLKNFDVLLVVCEGMGDFVVFRNHEKPVFCLCLTPLRPVFDKHYRANYVKERERFAELKLTLFSAIFTFIDRLAWKNYKHILCISKETYNRIIAGKLAPKEKMGFAFPGIDYKKFSPSGKREKYFLLPGRIMWTKNVILGITAFQKFQTTYYSGKDFRLVIAGIVDEKSKPYYKKLKELARDNEQIEFILHPKDEELFDLYDRCYTVLYTPFNEDWGMVPLEAMAYAKPVIAVNSGGPLEIIEHGKNGFLSEPNEERFAHYMVKLADSPERAKEIGRYGRHYVKKYDWKYFVKAIDNMLAEA